MQAFEPQMSSVGNFTNLYLLELQWGLDHQRSGKFQRNVSGRANCLYFEKHHVGVKWSNRAWFCLTLCAELWLATFWIVRNSKFNISMLKENHGAGYAIPTIREWRLNSMGLWKSSVKHVSLFLVTIPASLKRMNFQLTNLIVGVQGNNGHSLLDQKSC